MSDNLLRQHAGWSKTSDMSLVYIHQFGNESADEILKAQGYLPRENNTFDFNPYGMKVCRNCMKKNLPESISCAHCHLLIDHVALNEIMKEQEEKGFGYKEQKRKFQ